MRACVWLVAALGTSVAAGVLFAGEAGPDGGQEPAVIRPVAAFPPAGPPPQFPPRQKEGDRSERDDWHHNGRFRVPPIFRDVSEEDISDILSFLSEYLPWQKQDLEKMRQADPERFRQVCRRLRFEVMQLRGLRDRDKEAFHKAIEERQLKMRSQDLAAKALAATDPREREALTQQLRQVLARQFEMEMATREIQIRVLAERVEALRNEQKERAAHRDEIIENRLQEALKQGGDRPAVQPARDRPWPPGLPPAAPPAQ